MKVNVKNILLVGSMILMSGLIYAAPIPCSADYDGDEITDPAIYHPRHGYWEVLNSRFEYRKTIRFNGLKDAIPVTGDFDGDGLADYVCFKESTGEWLFMLSSNFYKICTINFGDERVY